MSYRIKINIYEDSRVDACSNLKYSEEIISEIRASEIFEKVNWTEGYACTVVDGDVLSFFEFRCIDRPCDEIIELVKCIPKSQDIPEIRPQGYGLYKIDDGDDGAYQAPSFFPNNAVVSYSSQTQCGAGASFGQLVTLIKAHPVWWWLIKSFISGIIKWMLSKLFRSKDKKSSYIMFSPEDVYRDTSQFLKIPEKDLQIIKVKKMKNNTHKVEIRTISDDRFELKVTKRGKIISLNLIEY